MAQQAASINYYDLLGVSRTATNREILAAYRQRARHFHPDRNGDVQLMQLLNEAKRILSDPSERLNYNETSNTPCATDVISGSLAGERPSTYLKTLYDKLCQQTHWPVVKEKVVNFSGITMPPLKAQIRFEYQPKVKLPYQTVRISSEVTFPQPIKIVPIEVMQLNPLSFDSQNLPSKIVYINKIEKVQKPWWFLRKSEDFAKWVPDNSSSKCQECKTEFSIFRRRHHCRLCGNLFCANCVDNFVKGIENSNTKMVDILKVCNNCFKHRHNIFISHITNILTKNQGKLQLSEALNLLYQLKCIDQMQPRMVNFIELSALVNYIEAKYLCYQYSQLTEKQWLDIILGNDEFCKCANFFAEIKNVNDEIIQYCLQAKCKSPTNYKYSFNVAFFLATTKMKRNGNDWLACGQSFEKTVSDYANFCYFIASVHHQTLLTLDQFVNCMKYAFLKTNSQIPIISEDTVMNYINEILNRIKNNQKITDSYVSICVAHGVNTVKKLIRNSRHEDAIILCKVCNLDLNNFEREANFAAFKFTFLSWLGKKYFENFCQSKQWFDAAFVALHHEIPENIIKPYIFELIAAIEKTNYCGFNTLLKKLAVQLYRDKDSNKIDKNYAYQILLNINPDDPTIKEINDYFGSFFQESLQTYDYNRIVELLSVTKAGTTKIIEANKSTDNKGIKSGLYLIQAVVKQNHTLLLKAIFELIGTSSIQQLIVSCANAINLISNQINYINFERSEFNLKNSIPIKGIFKTIIAYDDLIFDSTKEDLLEKVWLAFDSGVVSNGFNKLLLPCYLLLKKTDRATKEFVTQLMKLSLYIGILHSDPFNANFAFRNFIAMHNGVQIDSTREEILMEMKKFLENTLPVLPCFNLSILTNLECTVVSQFVLDIFSYHLRKISLENNGIIAEKARYFLFEGVWRGWAEGNFLDDRLACIKDVAIPKSIAQIMNWSWLPRNDGWISGPMHIDDPSSTFGEMVSATFDSNNGELKIQFAPGNLIHIDDFNIIRNVAGAAFTLDLLDADTPHHTIQKMRFAPKFLINSHPNYLQTLFQVDYLLKMITTKCEINYNVPFEIRESQLLKRLPNNLQNLLNLLDTPESIHRFWIESGDTNYSVSSNGSKIVFLFENPKMVCLEKKLKLVDGELVDDDSVDNSSATAIFAKNFTDNYETIGEYFPELIRLRELAKLQAFGIIIREWQQKYALIEKVVDQLIVGLSEIKNHEALHNVESIINEELRRQGLQRENVSNLNSFRQNLLQQQETFKTESVNTLLTQINKECLTVFSKFENVAKFSQNSGFTNTCKTVCLNFIEGNNNAGSTKQMLLYNNCDYSQCLHNLFKSMKIAEIQETNYNSFGEAYVPAIFGGRQVYGGVKLTSFPQSLSGRLESQLQSRFNNALLHNPGIDQTALLQKLESRLTPTVQVLSYTTVASKIGNRMPTNYQFAGTVYPAAFLPQNVRSKYPHSVSINWQGFPDFTPYAISKQNIELSGNRTTDERRANQMGGYKETPPGYTWHHHQDCHNGIGQMQLIPADIHNAVRHTGGYAIFKAKKT